MSKIIRLTLLLLAALLLAACSDNQKDPIITGVTTGESLPNHTVRKSGKVYAQAPPGQNQCLRFGDPDFKDHPNSTLLQPSEKFTKKWTILNDCQTSTEGWKAVLDAGDVLGPSEIALPNIPPGTAGSISGEFIAPPADKAPGVYSALYTILNEKGEWASGAWVDVRIR